MSPRRWLHLVIAGALWGAFGYLLGLRALGPPIWGGVLAGPIIGLVVGRSIQGPFERSGPRGRALWALVSVYLGATLFALASGLMRLGAASGIRHPVATLAEEVFVVWWGVTLTGFLLFLWPLAYGTHWLLEWGAEN